MQRHIVPTGAPARGVLSAGFGAAPPLGVAPGSEAASSEALEPARCPLGLAMEVGEAEAALAAFHGPLLLPVVEAGAARSPAAARLGDRRARARAMRMRGRAPWAKKSGTDASGKWGASSSWAWTGRR